MIRINLLDSNTAGAWTFCRHANLGVLERAEQFRCVMCKRDAAARQRRDNPDYQKEWTKKNPNYFKEWAAKDPIRRIRVARKTRGVTNPEVFDSMFEAQGFACAICETKDFGGKQPCLDHEHGPGDRGPARGVLCHKRNAGIGMLQDSVDVVRSALRYLERSKTDS